MAVLKIMARACRVAAAVAALGIATPAMSAAVFSENFNDTGFQGAFITNSTTDRFGTTSYYNINNYNGWTFTGSTPYYTRSTTVADGALVLNETTGAASRTITGLTVGTVYQLSLLMSGDNVTGDYTLNATIDGANILAKNGTVGASGTNAGTTVTALFTARSTSAVLGFTENSPGASSPMIDNVAIASVPEPSSWGMMICGFGMLGAAMRRCRRRTALAL